MMVRLRVMWCPLRSLALLAYLSYNFLLENIVEYTVGWTQLWLSLLGGASTSSWLKKLWRFFGKEGLGSLN